MIYFVIFISDITFDLEGPSVEFKIDDKKLEGLKYFEILDLMYSLNENVVKKQKKACPLCGYPLQFKYKKAYLRNDYKKFQKFFWKLIC